MTHLMIVNVYQLLLLHSYALCVSLTLRVQMHAFLCGSWASCNYTVFQKSDAKIQIAITMAYLIRIKYPLSGFNYIFLT